MIEMEQIREYQKGNTQRVASEYEIHTAAEATRWRLYVHEVRRSVTVGQKAPSQSRNQSCSSGCE